MMTRMSYQKGCKQDHPNHSSAGVHSGILTAPAPVSHHYIKRSSHLSSPRVALPQPRSPNSFNSASSCCTTTSTITSINSSSSSHLEPTHHRPSPLDASAIFHPYTPPAAFHRSPPHLMPSGSSSSSPLPLRRTQTYSQTPLQSQSSLLSQKPIHPIIQKSNLDLFVNHFSPATFTLHLPSPQIHLDQAMKSEVVDRFGKSVKFENLIDLDFKTVVIFIRHFRCGYSQRYIRRLSQIANGETQQNEKKVHHQKTLVEHQEKMKIKRSTTTLNPDYIPKNNGNNTGREQEGEEDELENWIGANGVKVIVIGHGNYQLIESYKRILNCPFPIYTDLSKDQKVYKLLGMNKVKDIKPQQTSLYNYDNYLDPHQVSLKLQASKKSKSSSNSNVIPNPLSSHLNEPLIRKGESKFAFLSQVIYNAWRMPWKWSGDPQQLGGEIILEPIREEKLIKRKPIKAKLIQEVKKTNSIRSNNTNTTSSSSEGSITTNNNNNNNNIMDVDSTISSNNDRSTTPFRRPSCSIKNIPHLNNSHSSLRRNLTRFKHSTAKEIQIQCKFIHQMTSFKDHFSIDELMMQSGIRLTSLMQKY